MNKPFTMIVDDTKEEIVKVINNSNLPAYVLKTILKELYQQIEIIEQQELEEYKNKKKKKESDK